jgi:hypothetical protein
MNQQTIRNIMEFMMRVQLTGQEVPAFNVAMNALQAELDSQDKSITEVEDGSKK